MVIEAKLELSTRSAALLEGAGLPLLEGALAP